MTAPDRGDRPLSIIIISWHFPPSSEVAGKTDWRLARALALRGVRVRVITPPISEAPALDEAYGKPIPTGLDVERVKPWWDPVRSAVKWKHRRRAREGGDSRKPQARNSSVESEGWARRVVRALYFPDRANRWIVPAAWALRRLLREEPTDLVISVSPVVSVHLAARLSGLPTSATRWYAWLHDPIVGNPFNNETGWAARTLEKIEAMIMRRADRVLVTTPALAARLKSRYSIVPPLVLPCSFAKEELAVTASSTHLGSRLELAHVGTLYGPRSPVPILESLARLRKSGQLADDAIRIRFVGSFEVPGELLGDTIERLGLSGVATAEPPVPQAVALQVLADADCGLLIAEGQPLQIPAKAYEYIGMRKPIFAIADGATADLVTSNGIGIACTRDELDAALLSLVDAWRSGRFADFAAGLDAAWTQYEAGPLAQRVIDSLTEELGR